MNQMKCHDCAQVEKMFVSVRLTNGDKVKMQKQLVIANVKEIYSTFKELHTVSKVGFSAFATLRPQWCLLAGSSGTHFVCVCVCIIRTQS